MKSNSETALLYLSNHFREDIKLADIAKQSGLSKFHFHRQFVKENQCTPQEYLEKLRIDHASHYMILFPQTSMAEVAFESGYSSPACFSRAFRKYHFISPTIYRERNRLKSPSKSIKNIPIAVQYLSGKTIAVRKVKLKDESLTQAYQNLIRKNAHGKEAIGFYLDTPIHVPQETCRHYIGINEASKSISEQTLEIPSGFYTIMKLKGGLQSLKESLFALHDQITSSGYSIDSLIGFEKIALPENAADFDYFQANRELFVKIRRQ